jgi:hypothetical protein
MHKVVEEHPPVGEEAGTGENGVPLEAQLPALGPRRVRGGLERRASLGRTLVQPAEKSGAGVVSTTYPNCASCATWGASRCSCVDLACGANVPLSTGTRSSVRRVLAISASNSGNNKSLIGTYSPRFGGLYDSNMHGTLSVPSPHSLPPATCVNGPSALPGPGSRSPVRAQRSRSTARPD